MKQYENVEMEIIQFESDDIVIASPVPPDEPMDWTEIE